MTDKQNNETGKLRGEGRIADRDDIAPQGEVVTREHILAYRASVEQANKPFGVEVTWDDSGA
ncbi:hypothetical protein [Amycolatopsis thailandensis]|uniref:hypothetical protein n=1 Tax=Amycolatopsis thailandensis TaxID=589330 RepID=UPI00362784A3